MTNTCRTCRDLACPNVGQDRRACEDHVHNIQGDTDHLTSLEQRLQNQALELAALRQRVGELEEWVADFQAAVVRRVQGL